MCTRKTMLLTVLLSSLLMNQVSAKSSWWRKAGDAAAVAAGSYAGKLALGLLLGKREAAYAEPLNDDALQDAANTLMDSCEKLTEGEGPLVLTWDHLQTAFNESGGGSGSIAGQGLDKFAQVMGLYGDCRHMEDAQRK